MARADVRGPAAPAGAALGADPGVPKQAVKGWLWRAQTFVDLLHQRGQRWVPILGFQDRQSKGDCGARRRSWTCCTSGGSAGCRSWGSKTGSQRVIVARADVRGPAAPAGAAVGADPGPVHPHPQGVRAVRQRHRARRVHQGRHRQALRRPGQRLENPTLCYTLVLEVHALELEALDQGNCRGCMVDR